MVRPGNAGSKGVPRAEREEQILEAAAEDFAQQGFAGMSVARLADRLDISKPLIYGYFGSKEQLYATCVRRAGQAIADPVGEATAAAHGSVRERSVQVLSAIFAALEPHPHYWTLLFDSSLPRGSAAEEAAYEYRIRLAGHARAGVLAAVTAAPGLDDQDESALVQVWMSVVSALVTWWLAHPEVAAQEMAARSERLFDALLG